MHTSNEQVVISPTPVYAHRNIQLLLVLWHELISYENKINRIIETLEKNNIENLPIKDNIWDVDRFAIILVSQQKLSHDHEFPQNLHDAIKDLKIFYWNNSSLVYEAIDNVQEVEDEKEACLKYMHPA